MAHYFHYVSKIVL